MVPKEGSNVWQDCLCIPNGAPHPENAHKFINYILDAKVGAAIAKFIYYATPNKAARALLDDDYNKNPAIFPDAETLAKCEPAIYLGEAVQRIKDEMERISRSSGSSSLPVYLFRTFSCCV